MVRTTRRLDWGDLITLYKGQHFVSSKIKRHMAESLGEFLTLTGQIQISDGKATNIISTKGRAKQLERNTTKCNLLTCKIREHQQIQVAGNIRERKGG